MRKIIFCAILVLALILVGISGCTTEDNQGPVKYTDHMGNTIGLEKTPEKVVALAPSITETMLGIGLGGKLVGCDEGSNSVSGAENLPAVSTWQGLDLEAVVALEPDIVLMDKTLDMSGDTYSALTGADIQTFVFFPQSLEDMLDQTELIGRICGGEEAADILVDGLEGRIAAVETAGAGHSPKPTVLYVTYYDGSDNPWVGTDSTISADLIKIAGGSNMVQDATGFYVQVSLETILAEDPDIIITSQSSIWPTTSRDTILADDNLKDVSAVKNDRVFDIDGDLVDRPGPRMVDGLEEINGHISDFVNA